MLSWMGSNACELFVPASAMNQSASERSSLFSTCLSHNDQAVNIPEMCFFYNVHSSYPVMMSTMDAE